MLTALAVVLVVLVGSTAFGLNYFGTRAKPGVTVLGQDVSGQDASQLTQTLASLQSGLSLILTHDGRRVEATADDLGVQIDFPATVAAVLAQGNDDRPWVAFNPWEVKPAPASLIVGQDDLERYLDQQFVNPDEETVEPSVVYQAEAGQFVVSPGKTGQRADATAVVDELERQAAGQPETESIEVETLDAPPVHSEAAAAQAAAAANARLAVKVSLTNGLSGWAERHYDLTPAEIARWTTVTPTAEGYDVGFDAATAQAELEATLNQHVGTPMEPTVNVLDPNNPDTVLGIEWGREGYVVSDMTGVMAELGQALAEGRELVYTVPLVEQPAGEETRLPPTNFDQPGGAKWIDVNKSTFRVTAYEGTTEVNSFTVSIGRGGQYETTDGTFYIWFKLDKQTMRGGTGQVEGRYEYATPVTWVSYFNADIAFHEADWNTWQGTWGMRVSHGCVNMPGYAAKWIYDWAPIGTKVVVHD